jgi:hypothetical protein
MYRDKNCENAKIKLDHALVVSHFVFFIFGKENFECYMILIVASFSNKIVNDTDISLDHTVILVINNFSIIHFALIKYSREITIVKY